MNELNRLICMRAVSLAALVAVAGCDSAAERQPRGAEQRPASRAEQAANEHPGRAAYVRYCVMCHGENLGGTQLGPSLVDGTWSQGRSSAQADIAAVVREGVPKPEDFGVPMPPAKEALMTEEQVASVAAYVASLAR